MRAYLWHLETETKRLQWEHLPLAVVPSQAARHLPSHPLTTAPALQTPSASLCLQARAEVGSQVPSSLADSLS